MKKWNLVLKAFLCFASLLAGILMYGNAYIRYKEASRVLRFSEESFIPHLICGVAFCLVGVFLLYDCFKQIRKNKEDVSEKKISNSVVITILVAALLGGIFAFAWTNFMDTVRELEYFTMGYGDIREDKPIIYLYPEEEMELTIQLGKPNNITCSYPFYKDGWSVIASPDGTIIDPSTNRKLYALYWEGKRDVVISMNNGFVVKGEDSRTFLEEKLALLGLNEREAEEFIVYWLPKLEMNAYNWIRFETMEEIEKNMPLLVSQTPDTMIRVWMQWKGLDEWINVPEQELTSQNRKGFTVVEWGGTEVCK